MPGVIVEGIAAAVAVAAILALLLPGAAAAAAKAPMARRTITSLIWIVLAGLVGPLPGRTREAQPPSE